MKALSLGAGSVSALGVATLISMWSLAAVPVGSKRTEDATPLELVESSLECRLSAKHVCATRDDSIGFVEDALPRTNVLRVERLPDGKVVADVLRSEALSSNGAVFSYVLDGRGQVLERTCQRRPLEVGMAVHALSPALLPRVLDGFLYVEDACDANGGCGNAPSIRYRLTVQTGRIQRIDREELWAKSSRTTSRRRHGACSFTDAQTPVPGGIAPRVAQVSGWVSQRPGAARLEKGAQLADDQQLYLAPWARLELAVGSIRFRFGGLGEPTLLKLVPNAELGIAWPAIEALAAAEKTSEVRGLSDRYLAINDRLYRVREGRVAFVCSWETLDARWSSEILPDLPAVFEEGDFVLPSQNSVLSGRCLPGPAPEAAE